MTKGPCEKCSEIRYLHKDHIVPKWQGGFDGPPNLQMICADCHHDKTVAESKGTLNKGRKRTPEQIEKSRTANLGRKQSAETIEKRAAKRRGTKMSAEACLNMSVAQVLRYQKNPADHARLVAQAVATTKGVPKSAEHRARIGASNKGRISPLKGKKRSPEICAKISAGIRASARCQQGCLSPGDEMR